MSEYRLDNADGHEDYQLKDIKYGLIVLDPNQEGDMKDIIHFVGYWKEPTEKDAENLYDELKTDEEFGLTEIIDNLVILPAPKEIVELYVKDIIADE